jgi:predicted phage tail protein
MADITKKVLKHTTTVATAIGKATAKGTVWTAEQVWNHKEEIAGGVVGGAAAVVTNTWLIGLFASIWTKVLCKQGQSNVLKVKSLKDTIETNKKILQRMKKKLQSC